MPKATTIMPVTVRVSDLSDDEKLRDLLVTGKGFRRDHPTEPWVCAPEQSLFAVIREVAASTRSDERRRCLRACDGAANASDARSRIRALPEEPEITNRRKGRQTK
jgi:hypothetical protein